MLPLDTMLPVVEREWPAERVSSYSVVRQDQKQNKESHGLFVFVPILSNLQHRR